MTKQNKKPDDKPGKLKSVWYSFVDFLDEFAEMTIDGEMTIPLISILLSAIALVLSIAGLL